MYHPEFISLIALRGRWLGKVGRDSGDELVGAIEVGMTADRERAQRTAGVAGRRKTLSLSDRYR